jgi:hypothetical protein
LGEEARAVRLSREIRRVRVDREPQHGEQRGERDGAEAAPTRAASAARGVTDRCCPAAAE